MTTLTFDSLDYFERLKAAGVPEAQAKVQADVMRQQTEAQRVALQTALDNKEFSTKGDVRESELRLQKEIRETELRLIKWQLGGWVALAAIMAKGFGWLGF